MRYALVIVVDAKTDPFDDVDAALTNDATLEQSQIDEVLFVSFARRLVHPDDADEYFVKQLTLGYTLMGELTPRMVVVE